MGDLYLPTAQSTNFELPKPGRVQGVCSEVIDLGEVPNPYQDGKPQRMVQFRFLVDQDNAAGQKLQVTSKRMALKNHEKASLTVFLQDWLGEEFTEPVNLNSLKGRPAMLKIIHVQGQKNTFANIKSIEPLPKDMVAMTLPKQTKAQAVREPIPF